MTNVQNKDEPTTQIGIMMERAIQRLQFLLENVPALLIEISEEKMAEKPGPRQWSKKEIMGHLIDSAANNHHRFVRAQFESTPEFGYDQNKWNEHSFHQQIHSQQIILFWTVYNKHLLEIMKRIPMEKWQNEIKVCENRWTIESLAKDYVEHLEHHLKQVVDIQ